MTKGYKPERFPFYLDNIMSKGPERARRGLDRLIGTITNAPAMTDPNSLIGKILFR